MCRHKSFHVRNKQSHATHILRFARRLRLGICVKKAAISNVSRSNLTVHCLHNESFVTLIFMNITIFSDVRGIRNCAKTSTRNTAKPWERLHLKFLREKEKSRRRNAQCQCYLFTQNDRKTARVATVAVVLKVNN